MYGNNKLCQIKDSGREERGAKAGIYPPSSLSCENIPPSLRPHKGLDGRPLGNTTDNSANPTTQGFQAIKERFKLLDSARKILDGERTQHCFYNRVDKNDGVGGHI